MPRVGSDVLPHMLSSTSVAGGGPWVGLVCFLLGGYWSYWLTRVTAPLALRHEFRLVGEGRARLWPTFRRVFPFDPNVD